ncbi:MAG: hypothetical protein QOI63_1689 [Thermoplasmata archaeon]|jgi:hypothetical protein|nr:hypothetical protein [Thermoplasmata archaeon]
MTGRRDLVGVAALACLASAGALEGLLLAHGPVLSDYTAVRLGPHGIFLDIAWLCVLGLGALGAIAGLASWTRTLFLTLLAVPVSWSLARASQHPWWLLKSSQAWHVQAPSPATLAGHALAVTLVCAAALLDALGRHRDAMQAQGLPADAVRRGTWRLGLRGLATLAFCLLLAFLLPGVLDGLAGGLRGALKGPAAFAALLASTAVLLLGLALLAGPGRQRRRAA